MKRLLTLDDLYNFYLNQNKNYSFNAKQTDETIVVHINETMNFDSEYDPQYGLLKTHLKSCHLYKNRNQSSISEDSMLQAIPSFYNRPILGKIHQLSDGSYDFAGHEITIKDGEIEYQEIPVGVIPESCNAQLVYDKEKDKTYLEVDGYIFEEYTKAADILREKGECKVSVEISVEEMSYSATDKVLNIEKFHFLGVTILGCTEDTEHPIEEGMYGSNITISDFSEKANSVFAQNDKLFEMLATLTEKVDKLSNISIDTHFQKGGNEVNKFEELLTKYNKTVEDIDFDYANMTNEELEIKFAELFEESVITEPETEPTVESDVEVEPEVELEVEPEVEPESELEVEPESESEAETNSVFVKTFEISHEDIRCALYNLLIPYEEADNEWYYITNVYDNYFVYEGYCGSSIYGQNYVKDGDNISLEGERFNLHRELLTDSEYSELQTMRANYASIQNQLEAYQKAESNTQKEAILNSEEYSCLAENTDFIELKKNMENYSIEDISKEADLIFAKHVKTTKTFSLTPTAKSAHKGVFFSSSNNTDNEVRKPYGGIFENYKSQK